MIKVLKCPYCSKKDDNAFFGNKNNKEYYICYNCGKIFPEQVQHWVEPDPYVSKKKRKKKEITNDV